MTSTCCALKLFVPLLAFLVLLRAGELQAASINCDGDALASRNAQPADNSSATEPPKHGAATEVNHFLHTVQCTLEKAKPWVERLETEAKKLEEGVRVVGVQMISRFSDLMDTLLGRVTPSHSSTSTSTSSSSSSSSSSATPSSSSLPTLSFLPDFSSADGPVTVAVVLETTDTENARPTQHGVKIEALAKSTTTSTTTEGAPPSTFVPDESAENDLANEIGSAADEDLSKHN